MAKLKSKIRVVSKTPETEGAIFVLKITTVERRDELEKMTAVNTVKARELVQKYEDVKAQPDGPDKNIGIIDITREINSNEEQKARLEIRWCLDHIENLEVDDVPVVTADDLFHSAPFEFVQEIHGEIRERLGLSVKQSKNSESPSTLNAAEGGQTTPITAFDAKTPETSDSETAASTFPNS